MNKNTGYGGYTTNMRPVLRYDPDVDKGENPAVKECLQETYMKSQYMEAFKTPLKSILPVDLRLRAIKSNGWIKTDHSVHNGNRMAFPSKVHTPMAPTGDFRNFNVTDAKGTGYNLEGRPWNTVFNRFIDPFCSSKEYRDMISSSRLDYKGYQNILGKRGTGSDIRGEVSESGFTGGSDMPIPLDAKPDFPITIYRDFFAKKYSFCDPKRFRIDPKKSTFSMIDSTLFQGGGRHWMTIAKSSYINPLLLSTWMGPKFYSQTTLGASQFAHSNKLHGFGSLSPFPVVGGVAGAITKFNPFKKLREQSNMLVFRSYRPTFEKDGGPRLGTYKTRDNGTGTTLL